MKNAIRAVFLYSALSALAAYVLALFLLCDPISTKSLYCSKIGNFGHFYSTNLRGSLFAGFLTLGGFLLSLKTFIIVNMKKEVYDNAAYQESWRKLKKLDSKGAIVSIYGPLKDLSTVLYVAILSCVSTAVSQLTIGLFESVWTSIFCVWAAAVSVSFLIWCLLIIRSNLLEMFSYLDKQAGPASTSTPSGPVN